MAGNDVIVKGWVLRKTPSGMGVVFMPEDRVFANEEAVLPKSQITVVKCVGHDELTIPRWLAEREGLA